MVTCRLPTRCVHSRKDRYLTRNATRRVSILRTALFLNCPRPSLTPCNGTIHLICVRRRINVATLRFRRPIGQDRIAIRTRRAFNRCGGPIVLTIVFNRRVLRLHVILVAMASTLNHQRTSTIGRAHVRWFINWGRYIHVNRHQGGPHVRIVPTTRRRYALHSGRQDWRQFRFPVNQRITHRRP